MGTHNEKFIIVYGYEVEDEIWNAHKLSCTLFPLLTSPLITFRGQSQFFIASPGDKEGHENDPENEQKRRELFNYCKENYFLSFIEVWDMEHEDWQVIKKVKCGYSYDRYKNFEDEK